eukprot:comp7852_c0_seq1/m.3438 comp7852_c0_seq1/g.3438  ORF comp7852_c0_seq1/g.3438 comp7852_c0_seq1/m.3438 type:complete len:258 (-) comp7852_c0_seq1:189-962(-)
MLRSVLRFPTRTSFLHVKTYHHHGQPCERAPLYRTSHQPRTNLHYSTLTMAQTSLWDLKGGDLLSQTASTNPTPGGGSVATMSGSLGMGLVIMALEVSSKRKDATDTQHEQLKAARAQLEKIRPLADEDVAAFDAYMAAMKLPKGTPEEQDARQKAMQEAALKATETPLKAARELLKGLEISVDAATSSHRNIVSDVGAGAFLLESAVHATLLNVDINLGSLNETTRGEMREQRKELAEKAKELGLKATGKVAERLQ